MNPDIHALVDVVKWLLGALFTIVAAAIGLALRTGRKIERDAALREDVADIKKSVKRIPALSTKVDQLAEFQTRMTSDFPKLREDVNVMKAKLGLTPHGSLPSMRARFGSKPKIQREEPEEDEE